jgi:exopolysaccharide biosynthesis polyprenyl glycosylphosphotransferase
MPNRAKAIILLLVDSLILFSCLTIIICIRRPSSVSLIYLLKHFQLFAYIFPIWIFIFFIEDFYSLKTYNPANLAISTIRSVFLSVVVSIIMIYIMLDRPEKPKTNLVLLAIIAMPTLFCWRKLFFRFFSIDSRLRSTILIGCEDTLSLVKNQLEEKPYLGYKVTACLSPEEANNDLSLENVQLIAIERSKSNGQNLYRKVFSLLGTDIEIIDLARFAEIISRKIPINAIDESWFVEYCGHQTSRSDEIIKALIDKFIAFSLLILCFPIALILIPILFLVHGSPIFFTQTRIGKNNKPFKIFKLRTMILDAEKDGPKWSTPQDSRITRTGKILRKTRIDELPQLYNILKGEMSLVGPRPERPELIQKELIHLFPYYNQRHLVKPGVTGWAQVSFRYGFTNLDAKEKLQYDLFYIKNKSVWLDFLIILKTIKTIITGAGH